MLLVVLGLSATPWRAQVAEAATRCHPALVALSVHPSTTVGGTAATGVVTLSCRPTAPIHVGLRAGLGARVPASLRLTRRTGTFVIRTDKTASARTVTIRASYGERRRTTHLSVSATCVPIVEAIGTPTPVDAVGGDTAVHYGDRVDVPITLSCAPLAPAKLAVATVPAGLVTERSVTVPAGSRSPSVSLTVSAAGTNGTGEQATLRIGAASAPLIVEPLAPILSWGPPVVVPVAGTAQLTLGIGSPQPTDMTIALSTDAPASLIVPGAVVVPAGATTVSVPVTAVTMTGGYQAHVTASFETQSVTTTVTVDQPG